MLSIEECRKYFNNSKLTDKEIIRLRNQLYALISQIIDNNLNEIENVTTTEIAKENN